MRSIRHGLTMIELIVVVAVTAAVLAIAAPSFSDMVATQRLRGINSQLMTDLQFARSEAVARNKAVRLITGSNSSLSCYAVVVTDTANLCDCTQTPGSICTGAAIEVRTVQVDRSLAVTIGSIKPNGSSLVFYAVNGSTSPYKGETRSTPPVISLSIDGGTGSRQKRLTTTIQVTGRPNVCYDTQYASVTGFGACASGNGNGD
jgi:type IV fimbrial biogenesis protein FimT